MSSIFPLRQQVSLGEREPRLVDLDDERADEVFEALSAGTTRDIFRELHREPQTASDLADATGTSVQNVQYHVGKLTDADLVEVVDTWYSERGSEMNVYAPRDESLVLFAGQDSERSLRRLLSRLVGGGALLLPVSLLVAWLARRYTTAGPAGSGDAGGADSPSIATEQADAAADAAPEAVATIAGLDPAVFAGLAFFLGGLFVLLSVLLWRRYTYASP